MKRVNYIPQTPESISFCARLAAIKGRRLRQAPVSKEPLLDEHGLSLFFVKGKARRPGISFKQAIDLCLFYRQKHPHPDDVPVQKTGLSTPQDAREGYFRLKKRFG